MRKFKTCRFTYGGRMRLILPFIFRRKSDTIMDMKKAKVENRILEVTSYEEYTEHPELYANTGTAVQFSHNGEDYVLPHRNTVYSPDRPGVYACGPINMFVLPTEENKEDYTSEVIDLSDVENIAELTKKMDLLKDMERDILTSPDNIFTPVVSETDSPIMRGLKEAVIAKHIDLDKYSDRFGDNFPNDKRQFKRDDMTLFMFNRMCQNLDIKAQLIIEDSNYDVPNPIGRQIVIDLVGGGDEET